MQPVIYFSNAESSVPWMTHQKSRPVTASLPLVHPRSVKWGGWRDGAKWGPRTLLRMFQHLSGCDDAYLLCSSVWFTAAPTPNLLTSIN